LQLWSGYGLGINGGTLFYAANGRHSWRDNNGANERMALTTGDDGGLTVMGTGSSFFAGNVGIGTATPSHKFHVVAVDAVGLFESSGGQAYLRLSTNEGLGNRVEITNRPGGRLSLWTSGAGDVFNITKDGNVGIGTTTPGAKLEINATSTTHGGWLEAIRFSRVEHSAITHPGGGLLFGLHSDRNFYFADIKDGFKKYVMAINADSGNVGIGISPKPEKRLHIEAGELRVRASHNNTTPDIGAFYAQNLTQGIGIGYNRIQALGSNAAQEVHIMAKGNAGVFLRTGGDRFVVMQADGNLVIYDSAGRALWASGTSISDVRVKENIHLIDNALAKVLQLRGVSFSWKDKKMGGDEEIGLVAQEVETVVPYLVHSVDQKTKMIRYEKCVPLLIEAIKEQQARIDQLRNEIQLLKS
jgi:hypothetical protein